jgi:tetratricopeptide (TPR) repeat protein
MVKCEQCGRDFFNQQACPYCSTQDEHSFITNLQNEDPESHLKKGIALYKKRSYAEALVEFNKTLILNDIANAHYYRGKTLEIMGRDEEASQELLYAYTKNLDCENLSLDMERLQNKLYYQKQNPHDKVNAQVRRICRKCNNELSFNYGSCPYCGYLISSDGIDQNVFTGEYLGGHIRFPTKRHVKLILSSDTIAIQNNISQEKQFYETSSSQLEPFANLLEIKYADIKKIENLTKDKISTGRVAALWLLGGSTGAVAGTLWKKEKLYMVLTYYDDKISADQNLIFDMDNIEKAQSSIYTKVSAAKLKEQEHPPNKSSEQNHQMPFDILKIRFVKGEITKEQFEEMKKVLES